MATPSGSVDAKGAIRSACRPRSHWLTARFKKPDPPPLPVPLDRPKPPPSQSPHAATTIRQANHFRCILRPYLDAFIWPAYLDARVQEETPTSLNYTCGRTTQSPHAVPRCSLLPSARQADYGIWQHECFELFKSLLSFYVAYINGRTGFLC